MDTFLIRTELLRGNEVREWGNKVTEGGPKATRDEAAGVTGLDSIPPDRGLW